MVTTLMATPFASPFPTTSPGTTPTLISGLNAAIGALVGPPPQPRRPRTRTFTLPEIMPSALSPAQTGWVCDALAVVAKARVSWQTVARFLGWLELQYQYGCGGDTAAIAADVWDKMRIKLQICGGDQEPFLPGGLELMKQFAGYAADAEVEPILLWIALADVVSKPAGAPRQTAVTIAAE